MNTSYKGVINCCPPWPYPSIPFTKSDSSFYYLTPRRCFTYKTPNHDRNSTVRPLSYYCHYSTHYYACEQAKVSGQQPIYTGTTLPSSHNSMICNIQLKDPPQILSGYSSILIIEEVKPRSTHRRGGGRFSMWPHLHIITPLSWRQLK